jgi:hypothetical protein
MSHPSAHQLFTAASAFVATLVLLASAAAAEDYVYFQPVDTEGVAIGPTADSAFMSVPPGTEAVQVTVSAFGYITPETETASGRYVYVRLGMVNRGDRAVTLEPSLASLTDDMGRRISGAALYAGETRLTQATVVPGGRDDLSLGFALPQGTAFGDFGSLMVEWPYRYGDMTATALVGFIQTGTAAAPATGPEAAILPIESYPSEAFSTTNLEGTPAVYVNPVVVESPVAAVDYAYYDPYPTTVFTYYSTPYYYYPSYRSYFDYCDWYVPWWYRHRAFWFHRPRSFFSSSFCDGPSFFVGFSIGRSRFFGHRDFRDRRDFFDHRRFDARPVGFGSDIRNVSINNNNVIVNLSDLPAAQSVALADRALALPADRISDDRLARGDLLRGRNRGRDDLIRAVDRGRRSGDLTRPDVAGDRTEVRRDVARRAVEDRLAQQREAHRDRLDGRAPLLERPGTAAEGRNSGRTLSERPGTTADGTPRTLADDTRRDALRDHMRERLADRRTETSPAARTPALPTPAPLADEAARTGPRNVTRPEAQRPQTPAVERTDNRGSGSDRGDDRREALRRMMEQRISERRADEARRTPQPAVTTPRETPEARRDERSLPTPPRVTTPERVQPRAPEVRAAPVQPAPVQPAQPPAADRQQEVRRQMMERLETMRQQRQAEPARVAVPPARTQPTPWAEPVVPQRREAPAPTVERREIPTVQRREAEQPAPRALPTPPRTFTAPRIEARQPERVAPQPRIAAPQIERREIETRRPEIRSAPRIEPPSRTEAPRPEPRRIEVPRSAPSRVATPLVTAPRAPSAPREPAIDRTPAQRTGSGRTSSGSRTAPSRPSGSRSGGGSSGRGSSGSRGG